MCKYSAEQFFDDMQLELSYSKELSSDLRQIYSHILSQYCGFILNNPKLRDSVIDRAISYIQGEGEEIALEKVSRQRYCCCLFRTVHEVKTYPQSTMTADKQRLVNCFHSLKQCNYVELEVLFATIRTISDEKAARIRARANKAASLPEPEPAMIQSKRAVRKPTKPAPLPPRGSVPYRGETEPLLR